MSNTILYKVLVINPTLAASTYRYEDITKLSRFALNAYAERYHIAPTNPAGGQPDGHSNPTERTVMDGTTVPPDSQTGIHYNNPSTVLTKPDAVSYLNSITYEDLQLSNAALMFSMPDGGGGGFVINGTEVFAVVLNKTKQNNINIVLGRSPVPSTQAAFQGSSILGYPSDASPPASPTDLGSDGDLIEIFLVEASILKTALEALGPTFSPATPQAILQYAPYAFLANTVQIPRFSFVPPSAGYSWVFSDTFTIDVLDRTNPVSPDSYSPIRALKPRATMSGNTFTVNLTVSNPTISTPFLPLMKVAIHNAGLNGINSVLVTSPVLNGTWISLVPQNPGIYQGHLSTVLPGPVAEGDVLQLFLTVDGDPLNVRQFTVTGPPLDSGNTDHITVTATEIIVDDGTVNVNLQLVEDYAFNVNVVNVKGTLYENNATTEVPHGVNDLICTITDGSNTSTQKVSVTAPGSTASGSHAAGVFSFAFSGSDFAPGSSIPFSATLHAHVGVVSHGTLTPAVDFYPIAVGAGADPNHSFEDVPISAADITSTAGVVTANVDIDDPLPEDGFALINAISGGSGPVRFFGDVIGSLGQAYIYSNYTMVVKVQGTNVNFQSVLTNNPPDVNGYYNFIIDATTPLLGRDLTVGDTVNISILDNNTSLVVPIASSSPVTGLIEDGTGTYAAGSLTVEVSPAMIVNASLSESPSASVGENLTLAVQPGLQTQVSKFIFNGTILDATNHPILPGASILIHNVTQGLIKIGLVQDDGSYSVTFESANFGLPPTTGIAAVNDQIRYILLQDLSPFLDPTMSSFGNPKPLKYPDTSSAGNDRVVSGSNFLSTTLGQSQPVAQVPVPPPGQPVIGPGIWGIETTITSEDINKLNLQTPACGELTENFKAVFHPAVGGEITVTSKPIRVGNKIPTRVLPYLDVTLPTNQSAADPFEFELAIARNALDNPPNFETIFTMTSNTPDSFVQSEGGRVQSAGSTNALRLYVFDNTSVSIVGSYAIALRVKMKRNSASGDFKLHSWGVRWWN